MSERGSQRPEEEHPEEALLWRTWAEDLGDEEEIELDEEILGLLDGTSRGEVAARARRRLAADPRLAHAFGELAKEARSLGEMPRVAAPGRRVAEARELVAPGEPAGTRFAFLRDLFSSPTPAVLAAAAALLLVTIVLRAPDSGRRPGLRADDANAATIETLAPRADATVRGDLHFVWRAVPEARSYRVVLMDVGEGTINELGATEETELFVPAADLSRRFGSDARTLHWVVRARLADGSEQASSPARIHWADSGPAN
jgi:hypothetical protein